MPVDPWYRRDIYDRAKTVRCAQCGARRGEPCQAPDGVVLTMPHERRVYGADASHEYRQSRKRVPGYGNA